MDEERQKRIEAAAKIIAARLATPEGQASMKAANEASLKRTQERIAASRMPEELWNRRVGTIYDPPIPAKKEKQRPYARSWTHESVQDLVASWKEPDYKGDVEEVQWDEAAGLTEHYAKLPGDETPHRLADTIPTNPFPTVGVLEMSRQLRTGGYEDPEIERRVRAYLMHWQRISGEVLYDPCNHEFVEPEININASLMGESSIGNLRRVDRWPNYESSQDYCESVVRQNTKKSPT